MLLSFWYSICVSDILVFYILSYFLNFHGICIFLYPHVFLIHYCLPWLSTYFLFCTFLWTLFIIIFFKLPVFSFFGSRWYFFFWAFKPLCHFDDNRSFFIKKFMALFALKLQRILSVTPERTVKLVTQSPWGKHHNGLIEYNFLMSIMYSFCKNSWSRTWWTVIFAMWVN